MRSHPHGKSTDQQKDHVLAILHIPMRPLDPGHPVMQIGIRREEQESDHYSLNDKQPSHDAAHQGDTHLLTECIHFFHQPVTRERKRDQTKDTNEHGDITYPVVMRPLFFCLSREVMVCGVSTNDSTTKHDVAKNPVNTNRIPESGMNNMPDISQETPLRVDSTRSLHERCP